MPNQNKERRFRKEHRSGIDWHIAYEGEGRTEEPIEGYVTGKDGETLVSIAPDANTGAFVLTVTGDERTTFSLFHEALDYVNGRMRREHAHGIGRYPVHRQTGREGLYSLGEMNGKEYIADAFWSDSEPGYINGSLFEIGEDGHFELITSEFNNGYLDVADYVVRLARDCTPLQAPDIRFVAECSFELDAYEEYAEALKEGSVDGGPVGWAELVQERNDAQMPCANQPDRAFGGLAEKVRETAAKKNATRIARECRKPYELDR